jgi:hypothetical protein
MTPLESETMNHLGANIEFLQRKGMRLRKHRIILRTVQYVIKDRAKRILLPKECPALKSRGEFLFWEFVVFKLDCNRKMVMPENSMRQSSGNAKINKNSPLRYLLLSFMVLTNQVRWMLHPILFPISVQKVQGLVHCAPDGNFGQVVVPPSLVNIALLFIMIDMRSFTSWSLPSSS